MMTEPALYRLLSWTSPGYPTGAFSYSHGLEWAVESGAVTNLQQLLDYVNAVLSRGGGWIDAVLFAHVWRATAALGSLPPGLDKEARSVALAQSVAPAQSVALAQAVAPAQLDTSAQSHTQTQSVAQAQLDTLTQLAAAFRGSSETALESRQQGAAFLDVTRKAWPHPTLEAFAARHAGTPLAHCVVVAVACATHDVALEPALHAYLHAVAANLVSAGARLIPLGQTQAQIAIARLSPLITDVANRALAMELDDLGTAAPAVELCSLKHETQYTRLFRS